MALGETGGRSFKILGFSSKGGVQVARKAKHKGFAVTYVEIEKLSGGKQERAALLYEKAAFMDEQLTGLQTILAEKGWTEPYQNGVAQKGVKRSSEADVYLALSKNYMAIMRQLDDLVSSASVDVSCDPLSDFV